MLPVSYVRNNRKKVSVSDPVDFLLYLVFISSLLFCEETCPSYLLLLIVKVKKANTVSCTDIKWDHICAQLQRISMDNPALQLVLVVRARIYSLKGQLLE